jgi:hypothetical protein
MESITISDVVLDVETSTLKILELSIKDPELCSLLASKEEEERKQFVERALRVGIMALQGMETKMQVDYVRSEFENMQKEVETELQRVFSDKGILLNTLDKFLGEKGELKQALNAHFGEQGSVIYRILNPDDETTPIGKFRKQLQQELDADREGTAFNKLRNAMNDGFKEVLIAIGAAEATEEEREKGTAKGGDLEDYVFEELDRMARHFDDTVEYIGDEKGPLGQVGDVLIRINPADTRNLERKIVVEVKNRSITMSGKNSFFKELEDAKKNRSAHYAIGAVQRSNVPDSCGCFRRYDGGNIICGVSMDEEPLALEVAYKVARMEVKLSSMEEEAQFDPSQFKTKIKEIEGQLDTLRAVKSALTGATGKINDAKDDLKNMEESIREILNEILTMIRMENSH